MKNEDINLMLKENLDLKEKVRKLESTIRDLE
jgi:hypothetical protein